MAEAEKKRNILLELAVEGVIPVLGGCAGALAGGPVAGVAGVAVGHAVERAINLFGRGIVERWRAWFAAHPQQANAAVAELARIPPAEARAEARSIIIELAPDAQTPDIDLAVEFVSAIPCAVDRALVPDPAGGGRSLPATVAFDDPRSLLQLLPEDVPPYAEMAEVPGTPYRLVELIGSGGFGAVYRAVSPTLQHLPLAIKFCLDRSLLPALNQERSNLERLMRAGGAGSRHVVRLYGYDLDHGTPYLVYEYVEGGDLTRLVAARRAALGRAPDPAEVLDWVIQIAEGLAFAHRVGLVHRDLKPANVLVDHGALKLADFGLGGVAAARAAARSRIGTSTVDYLSLADQASLFRGAGTPLYMSPEQRRGASPDPRHDLYALGVVWYQLLVGDVSRELHHGWAKELAVRFGVPAGHIALVERCVGWFDERPRDANELLPLLKEAAGLPANRQHEGASAESLPLAENLSAFRSPSADTALNVSQPTPLAQPLSDGRRRGVVAALARLGNSYAEYDEMKHWRFGTTALYGFLLGVLVGWLVGEFAYSQIHDRGYTFPMAFASYAQFDWIANAIGIAAGLLVWGVYVYVIRSGVRAVAEDLRAKADTIAGEITADFPEEVAAWGGRAVLRHPATVRQLLEELNPRLAELKQWRKATVGQNREEPEPASPPPLPPSPTSTLAPEEITSDPTRRTVMVARMRELARLLKDTKDNADATWVGLGFLWLLLCPGVGGAVVAALKAVEPKTKLGVLILAGILAGLLVAAVCWYLMARIRRSQQRKREAGIARFANDYPRVVEAWGGPQVLESQETLAALLRNYDPDSVPRPGWLRRLFGG
jgi:serine/threonine protein kinase